MLVSFLRITDRLVGKSFDTFNLAFKRSIAPHVNYTELEADEFETALETLHGIRWLRNFDFLCPSPALIPRLAEILSIRRVHDLHFKLFFVANAPASYAPYLLSSLSEMRESDRIVVASDFARQLLCQIAPPLQEYVRCVPHGVCSDTEFELPTPPKRAGQFVSVSRLHPEKLIHRQLEAVSILSHLGIADVRLTIVGEQARQRYGGIERYSSALQMKIKRLGLQDHIDMKGYVSDEERREIVSTASSALCLSVSFDEAFGKTIVEAMACGTTVIATCWASYPELLGNLGILVPVQHDEASLEFDVDAVEVARAMLTSLRHERGDALQSRARLFSDVTSGKSYAEIIEGCTVSSSLPKSVSCAEEWSDIAITKKLFRSAAHARYMAGSVDPESIDIDAVGDFQFFMAHGDFERACFVGEKIFSGQNPCPLLDYARARRAVANERLEEASNLARSAALAAIENEHLGYVVVYYSILVRALDVEEDDSLLLRWLNNFPDSPQSLNIGDVIVSLAGLSGASH